MNHAAASSRSEQDAGADQCIALGIASRRVAGQTESGDLYVVQGIPDGVVIGVVDGLGHGAGAAAAATIAVDTITAFSHEPIAMILKRCHENLKRTRGVVMSLAAINSSKDAIAWLTVGNVEGILLSADAQVSPRYRIVVQRSGVVGFRLPRPTISGFSLTRGDILVMATDGIAAGFEQELHTGGPPQFLANRICERHAKPNDDALILVAKYLGART